MSFENMITTAEQYRQTSQRKSNAHYGMSESASRKHTLLGVPAAIASGIVGTAIFSSLNSPKEILPIQLAAGLLSLLTAVLVSLQTFFNFADVAAKHREAAASYEAIRHKLDWFILANAHLSGSDGFEQPLATLLEISSNMDQIRRTAPSIPDRIYDASQTQVASNPILGSTGKP